jgi:hypothetical protein
MVFLDCVVVLADQLLLPVELVRLLTNNNHRLIHRPKRHLILLQVIKRMQPAIVLLHKENPCPHFE